MENHIESFDVAFTKADFPARNRYKDRQPGIHAIVAQKLMEKPKVWAKIARKRGGPMTKEQMLSLSTSLHAASRFGLAFQVGVQEDGHTYARFLGKKVPVGKKGAKKASN